VKGMSFLSSTLSVGQGAMHMFAIVGIVASQSLWVLRSFALDLLRSICVFRRAVGASGPYRVGMGFRHRRRNL
jgi:hypothetical protein